MGGMGDVTPTPEEGCGPLHTAPPRRAHCQTPSKGTNHQED